MYAENAPKRPELLLFEQKKVKQKDSKFKKSSLVGQPDRKNTKEKSKLLGKCFVNSYQPISAWNLFPFHFLTQEKIQRKG